ncbi:DUF802 domain-containing protein [Alcanivorax jadensis]|uniref:DUF802 domain-containing protein n=1 Tax=Alcanivorax jadensis TaxID=64988 RepID=UPI002409AE09|nr:DUF802 domain-containing protein [Alcanivorax jadensis]MDF1637033.1 DUF802 domain-containing protein [Alcanivorax jadensis]
MRRFLFAVPFLLGAIAVVWIAATFLSNPVALTVTLIIAAAYTLGFAELLRFRRSTATLDQQLDDLPSSRDGLTHWLKALPGSLRHAVHRRIDGHPAPLPGPQLTPYLTGLLVMLGLLGTFVGMIVTLQGAATALDGSSELTAIRSALAAPIAGLSLAFGTSIAGVAASAMLGLSAALCRRDRMAVSRKLDDRVDLELHAFSLDHQRQSAYTALQDQSRIFPELVSALQGLTGRMEQMGEQLSESLTRNQQDFHHTLTDQYRTLADSVSQSLKETLADSSRLAVENIQPIMKQSLADLSQQVQGTHETLNAITEKQLATLTERFHQSTESAAQHWQQGLEQHQQTSARLVNDISTSLAAHHDQFRDNSSQLLEQMRSTQTELGSASEQQLAAIAEQFRSASEQAAAQWRDGIDAQQASGTTLISELRSSLSEHNNQFQNSATGLLDGQRTGLETLVATVREELIALRDAEAGRSEAASERLAQLEGTVSEHLGRLGTALEAPMTRLIETASETPKAAAEVISRLREEMTRSSERDNELLEERRRIMAELDTLLSGQRDAAGAQRDAIETLITTASDTLTQVSYTFAQQVSAQSEQLDQVAGDVSGSAAEVASLSDAFATAVQVFSDANDKLLDNLQQVESRLEQSSARADEQLNYYVEQAREVIELSMASQKEVIDALGTLNSASSGAHSEERPTSEVN